MNLLFSLLLCGVCFSQEKSWNHTKNWKLYDLQNLKSLALSLDTLSHFKFIELNDDTMHNFLKDAVIWPKDKFAMWMGNFVVTYEVLGVAQKIDVSMYGGFFYDESTKRYYQLSNDIRNEWLEYLNRKNDQLSDHQ